MQNNELLQHGDTILRVLNIKDGQALIIDCTKKSMPKWVRCDSLSDDVPCTDDALPSVPNMEEIDFGCRKVAYKRYSYVASVLPFISDKAQRCDSVSRIAMENGISKQTVNYYLWLYLAYQNIAVLAYTEYVTDIFLSPMDYSKDNPISAVFYHHLLKTPYMGKSDKVRHTKELTDDIANYYHAMGLSHTSSIYTIQRVLLGTKYDFTTVCQIAYFLRIPPHQLIHPSLTDKQIQQENQSHNNRNKAPIDWKVLDTKLLPIVKKYCEKTYNGTSDDRPKRISERMLYRDLGIPSHQLENLPKCNAVLKKYTEPYADNWARQLVWAYRKLKRENGEKSFYWSDIRKITSVKKKNIDRIIPLLPKYTNQRIVDDIVRLFVIGK